MSLPEIWFCVIATLFLGYFVLEGFDFGVGMLMGFVGRGRTGLDGDNRRRVLLNTIGPVWDGNEVWLIAAVGAMFAAFPEWYATLLSAFYFPFFLILVGLIFRVCAIEWRGKINDPRWRRAADIGIGLGSWIPALLWGVTLANLVRGIGIGENRQFYGSLSDLVSLYALLGGATTLMIFMTHGAVFLALKTAGEMRQSAMRWARNLTIPTGAVSLAFLLCTQVSYGKPWTWALVAVAIVAVAVVVAATLLEREGIAFAATTAAIAATIAMLFGSLWPNVLPSTISPAYGLTIANASSSHYTLVVISWAALVVTPVVLMYQGWTYWVFRTRISIDAIPPSIGLSVRPEAASTVSASGLRRREPL